MLFTVTCVFAHTLYVLCAFLHLRLYPAWAVGHLTAFLWYINCYLCFCTSGVCMRVCVCVVCVFALAFVPCVGRGPLDCIFVVYSLVLLRCVVHAWAACSWLVHAVLWLQLGQGKVTSPKISSLGYPISLLGLGLATPTLDLHCTRDRFNRRLHNKLEKRTSCVLVY